MTELLECNLSEDKAVANFTVRMNDDHSVTSTVRVVRRFLRKVDREGWAIEDRENFGAFYKGFRVMFIDEGRSMFREGYRMGTLHSIYLQINESLKEIP